MRSVSLALFALLVLGAGPVAAQEQEEKKESARPPKSGDTIAVEGCLNGSMLEGAGAIPAADGRQALLPPGLNFQLKGKKNVLKDLTAKHDGQVVAITGVLKSNIDGAGPGTKIGNTRIVIGVQSTSPGRGMMPGTQEMLPVLEVKSFESEAIGCRR
jgi:hypothetical protein